MFTPEEWAMLKSSPIYDIYKEQKLSDITVATLVTDIKKVQVINPENMILLKYLYALLEMVNRNSVGEAMVLTNDFDYEATTRTTLNSTTNVQLWGSSYAGELTIHSVYQDSGGPLNLIYTTDGALTFQTEQTTGVADSTWTDIKETYTMAAGDNFYAKWSDAGGVTQLIAYSRKLWKRASSL